MFLDCEAISFLRKLVLVKFFHGISFLRKPRSMEWFGLEICPM